MNENTFKPKNDIPSILSRVKKPSKAVVTAGMPYANGPVHLGHLAGAHVPADIFARFMRMTIGADNVLFVCGTDDHGSNSEVKAKTEGISTKEFIERIHSKQTATMKKYGISLDTYTGTSREETYPTHVQICQDTLRKLHRNGLLYTKTSDQWYDPEIKMFLPDRFVQGTCPNCGKEGAYSEECDSCNTTYESKDLLAPKSTVSSATPVLKSTDHWYLNMWKVLDQLQEWLKGKEKDWRKQTFREVIATVQPCLIFDNTFEEKFKELKEVLPEHKSRYAPGKKVVVQFNDLASLDQGQKIFNDNGITNQLVDGWAHRSITRDVAWGIPVPLDIDKNMEGKSFYVWPESLVAPIAFTQTALKQKGKDPADYKQYWTDPNANVFQFIGVDNIYFYVLMQGAMWFGTQEDPYRQPIAGELQLTDVFSNFHLQVNGEKMSKSKGNFYSADELVDEMGYHPDQIRYFLAILSLSEKASNFDFEVLKQRNQFLAGPLNASFEKPISACHSKYDGIVKKGNLIGKTEAETLKMVQTYLKCMEKADYPKALFALENYARIVNSLFSQHKPHDDRFDENERVDALYSCFVILKNILIMLHPFAPQTMEKLRLSLNLPEDIYSIENFGLDFPADHKIGQMNSFFPAQE